MKIFMWLMGASGMGLQDKAQQIMAPIAPKSEGEIADAVEKWLDGAENHFESQRIRNELSPQGDGTENSNDRQGPRPIRTMGGGMSGGQ